MSLRPVISNFDKFASALDSVDDKMINELIKKLKTTANTNKKIFIFGNGGSASIASHISTDLNKNTNLRAINFNEASFLTCYSNDYGYESWVTKSLEKHCNIGDLVILISSSGRSQNMINAGLYCKKKNFNCITFTGMSFENKLKNINKNNLNFWIDSNNYNTIELLHLYILMLALEKITKKNFS